VGHATGEETFLIALALSKNQDPAAVWDRITIASREQAETIMMSDKDRETRSLLRVRSGTARVRDASVPYHGALLDLHYEKPEESLLAVVGQTPATSAAP
jgi:hypothetical protein